jgi:hypothetical protein
MLWGEQRPTSRTHLTTRAQHMANHLTNRYYTLAAHRNALRQAAPSNPNSQQKFATAHPIAAVRYRAQIHRARRARAALLASAADVIGRAL